HTDTHINTHTYIYTHSQEVCCPGLTFLQQMFNRENIFTAGRKGRQNICSPIYHTECGENGEKRHILTHIQNTHTSTHDDFTPDLLLSMSTSVSNRDHGSL